MDTPQIQPDFSFPSMVVILTNLATTFTLTPDFENVVFNIDGIPYFPPLGPKELEANEKIKIFFLERLHEAIETDYSIIILNNTPLTLQVLKEFREKTEKPNAADWLILSFFHEDTAHTENEVQVTDTEYLYPQIILDVRNKDIESLKDYPFVKKVFIPYGFQLTFEYLTKLFDKLPK